MPKKNNSSESSSVVKRNPKVVKRNSSVVKKKKKQPRTTKKRIATRVDSRGLKVLTNETKKMLRKQFHTPNEMLVGVLGGCWSKMSWSESFNMIDGNMNMVLQ